MLDAQFQSLLLPIESRSESNSSASSLAYESCDESSSPLAVGEKVRFDFTLTSIVEITPYSCVYGLHPKLFEFGADGEMILYTEWAEIDASDESDEADESGEADEADEIDLVPRSSRSTLSATPRPSGGVARAVRPSHSRPSPSPRAPAFQSLDEGFLSRQPLGAAVDTDEQPLVLSLVKIIVATYLVALVVTLLAALVKTLVQALVVTFMVPNMVTVAVATVATLVTQGLPPGIPHSENPYINCGWVPGGILKPWRPTAHG